MSKPALGRGLGALLGGSGRPVNPVSPQPASSATPNSPDAVPMTVSGPRRILVDQILPSPFQPRRDFTPESLQELADSIREQGILQPLVVRAVGDRFELIAGERRWRAARLAGLIDVPVLERMASDREVLELALIENLQRENLNPIEEALGYSQLQEQFQLTQEQVARKVGRGRAVVANSLRLLRLPASVQTAIRAGNLSVGHAKVILGLNNPDAQESLVTQVIKQGLSVRQTEELVSRQQLSASHATPTHSTPVLSARDPHVVDLEGRLRDRFATRVSLRYRGGKGSVEIRFNSDDELDRILEVTGVSTD
ncbi:MAG: ParB/RepB/Spo0J family partition protein [Pedosphaera sp.]|nr:ParB/RepB/Spo0J family partition protein [Pedosphaera sp.]